MKAAPESETNRPKRLTGARFDPAFSHYLDWQPHVRDTGFQREHLEVASLGRGIARPGLLLATGSWTSENAYLLGRSLHRALAVSALTVGSRAIALAGADAVSGAARGEAPLDRSRPWRRSRAGRLVRGSAAREPRRWSVSASGPVQRGEGMAVAQRRFSRHRGSLVRSQARASTRTAAEHNIL